MYTLRKNGAPTLYIVSAPPETTPVQVLSLCFTMVSRSVSVYGLPPKERVMGKVVLHGMDHWSSEMD